MRFLKANQPEETAEDRAAAVRLTAVASRSKSAVLLAQASLSKSECSAAG